jgi:hypothetical protein
MSSELRLTKNSHSFWHEKTAKTHSFAKRDRAKAKERRELATLSEILSNQVQSRKCLIVKKSFVHIRSNM